ncbi:MAG: phage major capsid protein [Christensenellaceae bacterium]|jgi:hypothetical protein|nr:phage major capsid protein [Christensenellaceae bacterium]
MVTITSAQNALKTVYLDVVSNQLNVGANPLLAKIKHTSSDILGKEIRKMTTVGLNGGIGAGSEDGALPASAGNNYVQFVTTLKNLYGTIEISDKALRASANDASAFVNLLNDEMEGLIKASTFNISRMLYGDGTGKLAALTAYNNTTKALTLDSIKNVMEGMVVDIYNNDTLVQGGLRIASVLRGTKQIVLSPTPTTAPVAGYHLYVQKSKGQELTGLGTLFREIGSIYGIDKVTAYWMTPYVANSVGEISDNKIQTAIDYLEEISGGQVDFITCSSTVKRAYQQYLSFYKRNFDIVELAGGVKALSFAGIPVVSDRFAPDDSMYLLDTKEFAMHQLGDWNWLEDDSGKIIRQVPGFATYSATLVKYADLICNRPNAQAKLAGISASVTNPFA